MSDFSDFVNFSSYDPIFGLLAGFMAAFESWGRVIG